MFRQGEGLTTRQRSKRTNRKRTKPVPEWKKLELVIAEIQKEIARDAVVKHNDKKRGKMVDGKPGKIRKLDVSIRKKIGTAEVLIAIDAKHHTRPVDRGLVAKFAEQVEDVNAHGIMISDSGFDSGARDVAHTKNILLQTYREAQEIDWKILVNSWLTFFSESAEDLEAYVTLENDPNQYQLKRIDTLIFDKDGTEVGALDRWVWDSWNNQPRPRPIGERTAEMDYTGDPLYIKVDEKLLPIRSFKIKGKMVIKKYLINTQIASGREIRDFKTNKVEYMSVTTVGFNLPEIMKTQPGILITNDEWLEADMPQPNKSLIAFQINPERPYHRLTISSGSIKQE
jgi:hypothetical protein